MSAMRKHSTFNIRRWRIVIVALFALAIFELPLPAQTRAAKQSSGRYLFIVDTSANMQRRAPAVLKAVQNLLLSGMHVQLQAGDTIGVWTYNQQLWAGNLPLQRWSPENEQLVASNIVAFLKTQRFEKKARLEAVLQELQPLVKESEKLTVLLISDGSQSVSGTPYDRNINEFFKANAKEQKQQRMPFITVLRSYHGEFIGASLNLAPWPVEFPAFPPERKIAAAPKPKLPVEKTNAPPTAPPLIVVGKKPEPPPAAPVAPPKPTLAKPSPPTNALPTGAAKTKPEPAPAPIEISKPTTNTVTTTTHTVPPTAPTTTATNIQVEAKPTHPAPATQLKPEVLPAAPKAVEPVIAKPAPAPTVVTPVAKPTELPIVASKPEPTQFPSVPPSRPEPEVASPAPHTDETTVGPGNHPEIVEEMETPATPPAQAATASQPEKSFDPKNLLIVGGAVLVLAVALFIFFQRRARAAPHASLITRSMDQDRR